MMLSKTESPYVIEKEILKSPSKPIPVLKIYGDSLSSRKIGIAFTKLSYPTPLTG